MAVEEEFAVGLEIAREEFFGLSAANNSKVSLAIDIFDQQASPATAPRLDTRKASRNTTLFCSHSLMVKSAEAVTAKARRGRFRDISRDTEGKTPRKASRRRASDLCNGEERVQWSNLIRILGIAQLG